MKAKEGSTLVAFFLVVSILICCTAGYLGGLAASREVTSLIKAAEQVRLEQKAYPVPENLSDWDMLQMAIIKTESDFKPEVNTGLGAGIYSITNIYVAEVNRLLGEERYSRNDALDPVKSKEMFDIIQGTYNPDSLVLKAIQLHNPDGGEVYKNKVMQNLNFIRRYENIRKVIKQLSL